MCAEHTLSIRKCVVNHRYTLFVREGIFITCLCVSNEHNAAIILLKNFLNTLLVPVVKGLEASDKYSCLHMRTGYGTALALLEQGVRRLYHVLMWQRHQFELIWEIARTDFKLRYSATRIGYLWAVLKPLATFLIINFVFSNVFRGVEHYPLQLLTGIILWSYFSEGTRASMTSLSSKAALLQRVPIPYLALLLSQLIHVVLIALINAVILVGFFIYYGVTPSALAVSVTAAFYGVTTILILGFGLLTAPVFVHYRDISQLWDIALRLGFYTAPIMYPLSVVLEHLQRLLGLNPISYIIHNVKEALVVDQVLSLTHLLTVSLVTIAGALFAVLVFRSSSRTLGDFL